MRGAGGAERNGKAGVAECGGALRQGLELLAQDQGIPQESARRVEITLDPDRMSATELCLRLQSGEPAVALDPGQRDKCIVAVNPMCLKPGEAQRAGEQIARALREA